MYALALGLEPLWLGGGCGGERDRARVNICPDSRFSMVRCEERPKHRSDGCQTYAYASLRYRRFRRIRHSPYLFMNELKSLRRHFDRGCLVHPSCHSRSDTTTSNTKVSSSMSLHFRAVIAQLLHTHWPALYTSRCPSARLKITQTLAMQTPHACSPSS